MDLPERGWRVLRALHPVALERYCSRVPGECEAVISDTRLSAHERCLRLFRLIEQRDRGLAAAFDDMRRSRAVQRLAGMLRLGVVPDEALGRFSPGTRESAALLADL